MMLVPYSRKNHSVYNPFQDFDDLEKAFFSDRSLGELKTDIKDLGESYALEADLPGFKKEDIHVDVKDNTLSITAERHSEFEQKDKKNSYLRCERSFGSYSRSFDVSGSDPSEAEEGRAHRPSPRDRVSIFARALDIRGKSDILNIARVLPANRQLPWNLVKK